MQTINYLLLSISSLLVSQEFRVYMLPKKKKTVHGRKAAVEAQGENSSI